MPIQNDLNELLTANIISSETAEAIRQYYHHKNSKPNNRLFIAFGILGALLVGTGIILILAHNWDNLSISVKLFFAFLPLIIGQGFCLFTIIKKYENEVWRESSAVFLVFAVGACIALVSQIYNIPGSLSSFLLTWILLCLPLIYILRSSFVSLLYLAGISWYGVETGYAYRSDFSGFYYWPLLMAAIPHYYYLYQNKPGSNFMTFHNWLVPISLTILLGTLAARNSELMFIAYISLFGLFYLIGNVSYFKDQSILRNGYRVIGAMGTIILLLILSFSGFWEELQNEFQNAERIFFSVEFITAIFISLLAGILLFQQLKNKPLKELQPIAPVFILFFIFFFIGMKSSIVVVLINLLVFAIGLLTIRKGSHENHLGILNYGLVIITALIICRFFDTELSFVWRGLLFVGVGAGFFYTNYRMLQKRKSNGL